MSHFLKCKEKYAEMIGKNSDCVKVNFDLMYFLPLNIGGGDNIDHAIHFEVILVNHVKLYFIGIMDSNPVTPQNEVGEPSLQNPNSVYVDQHRSVKTRVGIDSGEDSDSSSGSKNALYYLKRLRALQEQAGHDPSAVLLESKQQVSQDKDDNVVNDENLNKKSVLYDMPERVSFCFYNMLHFQNLMNSAVTTNSPF